MMKKIYYKLLVEKEFSNSDKSLDSISAPIDEKVIFKIIKSNIIQNYNFEYLEKQIITKDDFLLDSYIVKNKKGKQLFFIGKNNLFNNIDLLILKDKSSSYIEDGYSNSLPITISRLVTNLKNEIIIEALIKEDVDSKYSFNLKDIYLALTIYEISEKDLPQLKRMFSE